MRKKVEEIRDNFFHEPATISIEDRENPQKICGKKKKMKFQHVRISNEWNLCKSKIGQL